MLCTAFSVCAENDSIIFSDNLVTASETGIQTLQPMSAGNTSLISAITSFEFPMYLFLIGLAFILFSRVNVAKQGEWQENPFSLENSKAIQGFCAIAIVCHHMSQTITFAGQDAGALSVFVDAGVLFVGIFFFFSGYSHYKRLKTKDGYLKGFFKKRLPAILVPFFVISLVFMGTEALLGERFGAVDVLLNLSGIIPINSHMWYIIEILLFYVAFGLIFRFIKKDWPAISVMGVFVAAVTVISLLLGHGAFWFQGEWWYNTSFLFVIGILVAKLEKHIAPTVKRFYPLFLLLALGGFVGFAIGDSYALGNWSYYAGTKEAFLTLSMQLPMVIFFVLSVLLIMMKVKFSNPILKFLGSIALEIYLIHNLFIMYLRSGMTVNITSNSMYVLCVLLLAVGSAAIISGFDKYIVSVFARKVHPTKLDVGDKKIHSIDCMRLFAAFLVVAIHIPFAGKAGGIVIAFGKIAVPFFLVVCGYFLYRDDSAEFMKRLQKQTFRVFMFTVIANLLYIAYEMAIMIYNGSISEFIDKHFTSENLLKFFVFNESSFGGHLWYLGSLLYALLILMLLCKLKIHKYAVFAAPVLLAVYIAMSRLLDSSNFYMYRNALFCTLGYVLMGCLIRRFQSKVTKIPFPFYLLAAAVLCVTNVIEYNAYNSDLSVPYFSAELLVYAVVILLIELPSLGAGTLLEKLGRETSLFIYIVQFGVILALSDCIGNPPPFMTTLGPGVIFALTLVLAVIFNTAKKSLSGMVAKKRLN